MVGGKVGVVWCGWILWQDVVGGPSVSNVRFSFLWPNHFSMGAQRRLGSLCSALQGCSLTALTSQCNPHLTSLGSPQRTSNHRQGKALCPHPILEF